MLNVQFLKTNKSCWYGGPQSRQSSHSSSAFIVNLLPDGRTTLEGSSSKYAGLAQNDADKNAPIRIPKGVPVNKRIIAFDSYDVSICVNP